MLSRQDLRRLLGADPEQQHDRGHPERGGQDVYLIDRDRVPVPVLQLGEDVAVYRQAKLRAAGAEHARRQVGPVPVPGHPLADSPGDTHRPLITSLHDGTL
jgi:hypothetical protein